MRINILWCLNFSFRFVHKGGRAISTVNRRTNLSSLRIDPNFGILLIRGSDFFVLVLFTFEAIDNMGIQVLMPVFLSCPGLHPGNRTSAKKFPPESGSNYRTITVIVNLTEQRSLCVEQAQEL